MLTCQIDFIPPKSSDTVVFKQQVDKADFDGMRGDLSKVKWDDVLNPDGHIGD